MLVFSKEILYSNYLYHYAYFYRQESASGLTLESEWLEFYSDLLVFNPILTMLRSA